MLLSNLETDGSLLLSVEGETKTVTMLTDASGVPSSAYYQMPSGYVSWLSVVVRGNLFSFTAQNNLFSASSRSVTVQFCCLPTSSGTLQTRNVTVTQSSDAIEVVFDPETLSLDYTEGDTDTVAVSGIPTGATTEILSPSWITASLLSSTELSVSAALNSGEEPRTGSVALTVNGRTFYLAVTQAANTVALTFDPPSVSLDYPSGSTDDVAVTGIPAGASVEVVAPEWIAAELTDGTLTLTSAKNSMTAVRSGTVSLSVEGKTFSFSVSQAANPYEYGPLVLNETSHVVAWSGATFTVSATEMPTNATELTCSVKAVGTCVQCGDGDNKVFVERLTDVSFSVTVLSQDVLDGPERSFVLLFGAGNETANFTIAQDASPSVHRLYGQADKFVKTASSSSEPAYLVQSTSQIVFDNLKRSSWVESSSVSTPLLVGSNRDGVPANVDSLEAFKACYDHEEAGSTTYHRVTMGACVHRFKFSEDAYGLTLRGIRFVVRSDAYCAKGIRVALQTDNETDAPAESWTTIREGTGAFYKAGCAKRRLSSSDGLYYGTSETVIFDGINVTIDADTRLYLYTTMEDYGGIANGWIYGSGILAPLFDLYATTLIEGVVEDTAITTLSVTANSGIVLVEEGVPPDFPRHKSYSGNPGATTPRRDFTREFFYGAARVYVGTTNAARREVAGLLQGAAMGAYSSTSIIHPSYTNGPSDLMQYLKMNSCPVSSSSGDAVGGIIQGAFYANAQFGLVATFGHNLQVSTELNYNYKSQRVTLRLCPYVLPIGIPPFVPAHVILKNGATAIDFNGAALRLTAWFVPGYSALYDANSPLYPLAALAAKENFWTGEAATVTGTVSDRTSAADATAITYSLSATRLGKIDLRGGISANAEVRIACETAPTTFGMIILTPMVMDAGLELDAGIETTAANQLTEAAQVGLGTWFLYTATTNNTGWRPEVRIER